MIEKKKHNLEETIEGHSQHKREKEEVGGTNMLADRLLPPWEVRGGGTVLTTRRKREKNLGLYIRLILHKRVSTQKSREGGGT